MKRVSGRIAIISGACVLAAVLWWCGGCSDHATHEEIALRQSHPAAAPVVRVKTLPIRKGTISEEIMVYGQAVPAPGGTEAVSVPFESLVRHIMVSTGQAVMKGNLLIQIEPSPDTNLAFQQAQEAYDLAKKKLEHVQQLYDLKLATNTELLLANQDVQQAELSLENMKRRGIGGQRNLLSDIEGVIQRVDVQEGAIVPAGNPLVEIVAQNRLEVRLGVEPEDISRVRVNQRVLVRKVHVGPSSAVAGTIREISRSVDPSTRLVDVFVALPTPAQFLLGESVLGTITIASSDGLIVPRSAVLPEEDTHILFTIKDVHAVRRTVQVGLENNEEVEIMGSDLQPGDPVVVLGNYELTDGMAVEVEASQ